MSQQDGQQQTVGGEFLFTMEAGFHVLRRLIARLPVLIAVFVVTAVVVFGLRSLNPPQYTSEAVLVLSPAPLKQIQNDELSRLMPRTLTIQDYEIIALSDPVLQAFRARAGWADSAGRPIRLQDLRESISTRTTITKRTNIEIEHSPLLLLRVKTDDGARAAEYANAWAEVAVEASRSYSRYGARELREFLETEFTESAAEYQERIGRSTTHYELMANDLVAAHEREALQVAEFQNKAAHLLAEEAKKLRVEDLEAEVERLRKQQDEQYTALSETRAEARAAASRLARLEESLAQQPVKHVLNIGLTETALAIAASLRNDVGDALRDRTVLAEQLNPLHETIGEQTAITRAEAEGLASKEKSLEEQIAATDKAMEEIYSRLKDAMRQYEELERDLKAQELVLQTKLAQDVKTLEKKLIWETQKIDKELESQAGIYSSLNTRALSARLAEAEMTPDLRVLVPAQPSADPLPRGRALAAVTSGLVAAVLALMLILLLEGLRLYGGAPEEKSSPLA